MNLLLAVWGFSLITQLGKHSWPAYAFVGGLPSDYLSAVVYGSEVLSFLLILTIKPKAPSLVNKWRWLWLLPLANILLAFSPDLALLAWMKLILLLLVVLAATQLSDRQVDWVKRGLLFGLGAVLVLGLLQLWQQHSAGGWWYWLGERRFDLSTPGIARLDLGGRLWLRPYASFSHPNSLAGFLLGALVLFRQTFRGGKWGSWLTLMLSLMILFTGSRIALIASLLFLVLSRIGSLVQRRGITKVIAAGFVVLTLIQVALPPSNWGKAISQRLILAQTAVETFFQYPLGVGLGNSIPAIYGTSSRYRFNFWYQPVHNVWLLLLVETGVVGLGLIVWGTVKFIRRLLTHKFPGWWAAWLAILFTFLFDHYWLTLVQNRLLLALLLGLTLRDLTKKSVE